VGVRDVGCADVCPHDGFQGWPSGWGGRVRRGKKGLRDGFGGAARPLQVKVGEVDTVGRGEVEKACKGGLGIVGCGNVAMGAEAEGCGADVSGVDPEGDVT
jgi:hypothetical protein